MSHATPFPLKVGTVSRTFFTVPIWAGLSQGFFEREGLQVTLEIFGNASQVEPLCRGDLHIAVATPEAVLQNVHEGGPLRFLAGNADKMCHFLIAQPKFRRVEDLRGATIGILNRREGTFFHLVAMMERHGLRFPGDYEVVDTGGVPPRHKALLEGRIDAGLQSIPWAYLEQDAGFSNLGDVSEVVPAWQFTTVNASRDWAAANADVVVRFLRALQAATDWIYREREACAELVAREMDISVAHAARGWDYITQRRVLTPDLSLDPAAVDAVRRTQIAAGLLAADAPADLAPYCEGGYLQAARRAR
jgi:ABC-type nitrate/sulfonate/bicarbonate transport system substrate-binding protein